MRAAVFEEPGEPADALRVQDLPPPEPGPGDVVVHVDASVVQPADSMFIRGRYRIKPNLPQVAGLEGTGVVLAAGVRATIVAGTRVAFRHPGAWAELVAVPAERCYAVPKGIDIESAAQFALNPVTAWGLLDEVRVRPGDWLLVDAARSAVARIVASIAQWRGVHVLGVARPADGDALSYPLLTSSGPKLAADIDASTGGEPVAGFLDSVGGAVISAVLPALRQGATIVSYGVLDDAPIPIRNSDLIYRNLTWEGFGIDHWLATTTRREAMAAELWRLLADGVLELPVAARFPLDDIRVAVAAAATSVPGTKVLVIM